MLGGLGSAQARDGSSALLCAARWFRPHSRHIVRTVKGLSVTSIGNEFVSAVELLLEASRRVNREDRGPSNGQRLLTPYPFIRAQRREEQQQHGEQASAQGR